MILVYLLLLLACLALAISALVGRARGWRPPIGVASDGGTATVEGFSIGIFLLPIAALMFVAALLGRVTDRTA